MAAPRRRRDSHRRLCRLSGRAAKERSTGSSLPASPSQRFESLYVHKNRVPFGTLFSCTQTEGFEPSCPGGQTHFECAPLWPLRYVSLCENSSLRESAISTFIIYNFLYFTSIQIRELLMGMCMISAFPWAFYCRFLRFLYHSLPEKRPRNKCKQFQRRDSSQITVRGDKWREMQKVRGCKEIF